jgi:hypothetical protein
MKKNYFKSHGHIFSELERKTIEDFRSRRPLEPDEEEIYRILKSIKQDKETGEAIMPELSEEEQALLDECDTFDPTNEEERKKVIQEIERVMNYLRPGRRYPLLAHNPNRVQQGRRFAYIGTDGKIHVGRKGGKVKVPMMPA